MQRIILYADSKYSDNNFDAVGLNVFFVFHYPFIYSMSH